MRPSQEKFEADLKRLLERADLDADEKAFSLRKFAAECDAADFAAGPVCPGER